MTRDNNLGFVTTLQTLAPQAYLVGDITVKPLLARILPPTRLMDNMRWSMDSPQKEEFAIANMFAIFFLPSLVIPSPDSGLFQAICALPGYKDAESAFREYVVSRPDYKKNVYQPPDHDVIRLVNQYWEFALRAWDYPILEP
jgi:hypothetical protein